MEQTQHQQQAQRQDEQPDGQWEPREGHQQLRDQLESSPTLRLVSMAGHVVGQRFGRIFGEQDGLSPSGAAVLNVIGWAGRGREKEISSGRVAHAELARRCMITPATLTGVVSTLVKAGYLRRERDAEDRRVVWLVLTEAGTERVRQLRAQIREIAASVSASLDPEHEAIIRDFLVNLVCRLSAADSCITPTGPMMFGHRILNGHVDSRAAGNGHAGHEGYEGHESHEGGASFADAENGTGTGIGTGAGTGKSGCGAMGAMGAMSDTVYDADSARAPDSPEPSGVTALPTAHVSPSVDVSAASEPGGTLG